MSGCIWVDLRRLWLQIWQNKKIYIFWLSFYRIAGNGATLAMFSTVRWPKQDICARGDVNAASSSSKVQKKSGQHGMRAASERTVSTLSVRKPGSWTQTVRLSSTEETDQSMTTDVETRPSRSNGLLQRVSLRAKKKKSKSKSWCNEQTDTIPFNTHYRPKVWKQAIHVFFFKRSQLSDTCVNKWLCHVCAQSFTLSLFFYSYVLYLFERMTLIISSYLV